MSWHLRVLLAFLEGTSSLPRGIVKGLTTPEVSHDSCPQRPYSIVHKPPWRRLCPIKEREEGIYE